jgi:hypothetical protein
LGAISCISSFNCGVGLYVTSLRASGLSILSEVEGQSQALWQKNKHGKRFKVKAERYWLFPQKEKLLIDCIKPM